MTLISIVTPPMADYLVRLRPDQLDALQLVHLHSEYDAPPEAAALAGGWRGYTEWIAQHIGRSITLGWDWELDGGRRPRLREGLLIRTNIMLQDRQGADLGRHLTLTRLFGFISRMEWQEVIRRHLMERPRPSH